MAKCKSCQVRVEWTITENGKKMPIDPRPNPEGNVIKTGARVDGLPEVHVINFLDTNVTETRYTSHFATCEFADIHRKERSRDR